MPEKEYWGGHDKFGQPIKPGVEKPVGKSGVDWGFISEMEGGARTKGYIPMRKGEVLGKSGLTIATGWDVGQTSLEELKSSGLSSSIIEKVSPYVGLRGPEALKTFKSRGAPSITGEEASAIDKYTHGKTLSRIKQGYESSSGKSFGDLSSAQQTVLASVGFQYGSNLKSATPGFWKQATSGDWTGAHKNLQNFGDVYGYRRGREADLLGTDLAMSSMPEPEKKLF